jgi:hypothetical protein
VKRKSNSRKAVRSTTKAGGAIKAGWWHLSGNTEYPYRLYLLFVNRAPALWHLYGRSANMFQVQVLKAELLEAMKGCLHDLEEMKLLSPGDLDIIDERRVLRRKIAELED